MHRIFKKDQVLTVPNLLSAVRLALIPLIIWLYCVKREYRLTVAVVLISALTDVLDGFIARRFNMTSDFGKIIDPIADKLTQATLIFCLASKHRLMIPLIILFAFKELVMAAFGCAAIKKKDSVNSAKWYGKANTVVVHTVSLLLIIFPDMPDAVCDCLIILCGVSILLCLAMYSRFYIKLLSSKDAAEE